jgi:hypothetical protein
MLSLAPSRSGCPAVCGAGVLRLALTAPAHNVPVLHATATRVRESTHQVQVVRGSTSRPCLSLLQLASLGSGYRHRHIQRCGGLSASNSLAACQRHGDHGSAGAARPGLMAKPSPAAQVLNHCYSTLIAPNSACAGDTRLLQNPAI